MRDLIAKLHDSEHGYNLLLDVYKSLLDKESSSTATAIKAQVKYSDRGKQLHKDLMELFKTASKEKRDLIKNLRPYLSPAFK